MFCLLLLVVVLLVETDADADDDDDDDDDAVDAAAADDDDDDDDADADADDADADAADPTLWPAGPLLGVSPLNPARGPLAVNIAPRWGNIASRWGNIALRSCSQLDPSHLNMGPWPAVAHVGLSCGQCGPILWLCWPMFGLMLTHVEPKDPKNGNSKKNTVKRRIF